MTSNRFQCPWCQKEVELPPEAMPPKEAKKKTREIEIIQTKCPSCQRLIQMSRQRRADDQKQ